MIKCPSNPFIKKTSTGLGLAIVKRFATQMGGNARAYLEGKRFTIEVVLPLSLE